MIDLMVVAAIYARVSSDRQAREGTIASQLQDLHARVRADGLSTPPELVFTDEGYSGSSLVRPALETLRDTAAAGGFARLYVHCPDRLAREFADQIVLIDELHRAGVEVRFLNHEVDGSPEGELLLQVQGVIAQYERSKIRERSRRGRQHAARCGVVAVLGGAPYGYHYVTKSEGEGRAEYQVILDEARAIRQIFDWVGREGCSLAEVVRRLVKEGIPTRRGLSRWDPRTVARILANPAYKGTAGWGKTQQSVPPKPQQRPRLGQPEFPRRAKGVRAVPPEQWSTISVPALVDEETFAAAQEQVARNRARHGRPAVPGRYLLSGLLVCRHCGRACCGKQTSVSRSTSPEKATYGYYHCCGTQAHRFGGQRLCSNRPVRTDRLDAAVWGDVCALLLDPARVEAEYRRRLEGPATPSEYDREVLEKQRAGTKRRIARLTEMYEDGFLEREDFQQRMTSAQSRLKGLEAESREQAERETNATELRLVLGQLETFSERVRTGLSESDWESRRSIVRALVKRIEIGETEVRVVYKISPSPFERAPQGRGVLQNRGRALVSSHRQFLSRRR